MENFIIEKIQEIAFEQVKSDDSLWQSKVLDSITIVELVVELETEYNISIPFKDIIEDNFETVSRIVKYLASKTN